MNNGPGVSREKRSAGHSDLAKEPAAPSLPGLPERYRLVRLLGQGSQKTVYLAHDTRLDRQVAVGVVNTRQFEHSTLERLHEARTMARIGDYPHVVAVHDVLEGADAIYIVTRYLPGGDLATQLASHSGQALPVRRAIKIAAQVARALECAHEHGIAHRDLKPGNIFLNEHGDAFLGDFGLAGMTAASGSEQEIVGTPVYMAPEQLHGAGASPSSDLYSLGCVLYELTTGAPPFVADSGSEVLRMHAEARPMPPRERHPAIPPALDDLILKLLDKQPANRPASSRDVRAALEGILRSGFISERLPAPLWPVQAAERPEPPIVGREREIRVFEAAVQRVLSGEPGLALVEGEVGTGKSRLLRELRTRAEAKGCVALFGVCHEDVALPYRPFVEAFLPLASRLSELDAADAQLLREFLHLGPARLAPWSAGSADSERHRLFLTVFRALGTLSRSRPIVLFLDDLHWADSATLDLLEHLASGLSAGATRGELNLVLGASFRPVEPDHRVGRVVARLRRESLCRSIELSGLDDAGVYEVVSALTGGRPSNQLVQMVNAATHGNPLFVREVLDHLDRQGLIQERRGFLVCVPAATDPALPSSVRRAIEARTRELTAPCRRVLMLASFLGNRFEMKVLSGIAPQTEENLGDLLDEAVTQRLLVDDGEAYHFAHPLIRHIFYHEPGPSRRRRFHLQVARRLEELSAAGQEPALLEIAHHLVRAGSLAHPAKVLEYARRAADEALAKFAWNEATQLLEAAVAAGHAHQGFAARDLAELHHKAGIAYHKCFDTGPCLEHLDAAVEGFRSAGDLPSLARAVNDRARAAVEFGLPAQAISDIGPLEEALGGLGSVDRSLRARILGTLSECLWLARDSERAEDLAASAMRLASEERDDELCVQGSINLALVQLQTLRLEDALSSYRIGIAHARRSNDVFGVGKCLQRTAQVLFIAGRLEEAHDTALETGSTNLLMRSAGDALLRCSTLASIAAARGDFEATERMAQEAIHISRRAKYPWAYVVILPVLAYARAMRGDWAGANEMVDLTLEPGVVFEDPAPLEIFARSYRRLIDAYAGTPLSAVDDVPALLPAPGQCPDGAALQTLCAHVELCDAAGSAIAPGASAALRLAEQRRVVFAIGWPFFLARIQAVAASVEQRWDEAEDRFTRTIKLAGDLGARPEVGRSCLDYARMLVLRGRPGDEAVAAELLGRALPILQELCPRPFELTAQRLAAALQGRTPGRGSSPTD